MSITELKEHLARLAADMEDLELPRWRHDGTPVKTVDEVASILGIPYTEAWVRIEEKAKVRNLAYWAKRGYTHVGQEIERQPRKSRAGQAASSGGTPRRVNWAKLDDVDRAAKLANAEAQALGFTRGNDEFDGWELWIGPDDTKYEFGFDQERGRYIVTHAGEWEPLFQGEEWQGVFRRFLDREHGRQGAAAGRGERVPHRDLIRKRTTELRSEGPLRARDFYVGEEYVGHIRKSGDDYLVFDADGKHIGQTSSARDAKQKLIDASNAHPERKPFVQDIGKLREWEQLSEAEQNSPVWRSLYGMPDLERATPDPMDVDPALAEFEPPRVRTIPSLVRKMQKTAKSAGMPYSVLKDLRQLLNRWLEGDFTGEFDDDDQQTASPYQQFMAELGGLASRTDIPFLQALIEHAENIFEEWGSGKATRVRGRRGGFRGNKPPTAAMPPWNAAELMEMLGADLEEVKDVYSGAATHAMGMGVGTRVARKPLVGRGHRPGLPSKPRLRKRRRQKEETA